MPVAQIEFLYTNIGRGHPFYLDGIAEALIRCGQVGLVRNQRDVFELSRGLSRGAWRLVKAVYRTGSGPGPIGRLYSRWRQGVAPYEGSSPLVRLLGRSLAKHYYRGESTLVLVAHPVLVAALADRADLIYQHGELVVPREALVPGASTVLVPTADVADKFRQAGYAESQILVTGLCIEPSLTSQADDTYRQRQVRLGEERPLTGAFYSSGAEPSDHVEAIGRAVKAVIRGGYRTIVFCKCWGKLDRAMMRLAEQQVGLVSLVDHEQLPPVDLSPLTIVRYRSRREETALTAKFFPWFDFFAAPAHERSNWAIGLGLPMFVIGPDKGSFAPLNKELLLSRAVASQLEDAGGPDRLDGRLKTMSAEGRLLKMSQSGWKRNPIDGFDVIASYLLNRYSD